MADIESKVKEIIVNKLGVDDGQITPEASFTNDLGADSLDTVELVMEFEKAFNLQFVGMMGNFQLLLRSIGGAVVLTMLLVSANTMMAKTVRYNALPARLLSTSLIMFASR